MSRAHISHVVQYDDFLPARPESCKACDTPNEDATLGTADLRAHSFFGCRVESVTLRSGRPGSIQNQFRVNAGSPRLTEIGFRINSETSYNAAVHTKPDLQPPGFLPRKPNSQRCRKLPHGSRPSTSNIQAGQLR